MKKPLAPHHRPQASTQEGFTLPMTMLLVVVLSLLATAIMARMYVGIRQEGFNREHQGSQDAATIGLNMAIDEISPGIDRMKNAVFSAATMSIAPPGMSIANSSGSVQAQLDSITGQPTSEPVRELALLGNIRNWQAFADWTKVPANNSWPNIQGWANNWKYVPRDSTVQYFDDIDPGVTTPKMPINVGNVATTGNYWYQQLQPAPPADVAGVNYGSGPVPSDGPPAPQSWRNHSLPGQYNDEYPNGLFDQPILRKIYQVRPNVRVAVYVRMSLQDYFGGNGAKNNHNPDGWFFTDASPVASNTFNAANFYNTNAITFSIFAVSQDTPTAKGVRIHQALNVAVGGAEYLSGGGAGEADTINGLENQNRLVSSDGGGPGNPPSYYMGPYFAPALDTPAGNNTLVAYTPITGQVYPASCDLAFNPQTRSATEQVVFLYERIQLPKPNGWNYDAPGYSQPTVVFLIERIPSGVSGAAQDYWRRRLIFDYPAGALSNPSFWGSPPSRDTRMQFAGASYSIDPWANPANGNAGFPSMAWWGNLYQATASSFSSMIYPSDGVSFKENFNTGTFQLNDLTGSRYPYSATLKADETFTIGTQSATVPAGNAAGDVVVWKNNPLQDYKGGQLSDTMPWQGPAVPISQSLASVSYYVLTWPQYTLSTKWNAAGGGIGIPFAASTQSIRY